MTEKLYDIDSYISEFEATVLSCEKVQNGYKTVLDKTAFFPEGGGQAGDIGIISGVKVLDTQIEGNIIYHYTENALKVGEKVIAAIDFGRRFAFMQNHTGEHIVSGIVNRKYGYHNVGFHLGDNFVTLDFNGELSRSEIREIELIANRAVWQNNKVSAYYPKETELENINYRSKGELEGAVRIVQIENVDICACCAPHVKTTGEIGIIKLLDSERMRGGIRIVMKCGEFALADYNTKYDEVYKISSLLSAKQNEVYNAVVKLDEKLNMQKAENAKLQSKIIEGIVKTAANQNAVFVEKLSMSELQELADGLHKTYGGLRAAFSQSGEGFAFAICGEEAELQEFFVGFKNNFSLRGGGRGKMVQGSVFASREKIEEYFK